MYEGSHSSELAYSSLVSLSLKKRLCSTMACCIRVRSTPSTQVKARARNITPLNPGSRSNRKYWLNSLEKHKHNLNINNKTASRFRLWVGSNLGLNHMSYSNSPSVFSISPRTKYWAPSMGWKGSTSVVCTDTRHCAEDCWPLRTALDSSGT